MFIPVLQLNQSQVEKSQGQWQKCKAQNLNFQLRLPRPSPPHPTSVEEYGTRGRVGEKEGTPGRELQRVLISLLWLSTPVPTFSVLFIFICHFGLSSQIESCFPNWPVKSFCHVEIISRAKSGNLRQPGNLTAGWNVACNKRQCE